MRKHRVDYEKFNVLFLADLEGEMRLNPLVGYLLNLFEESVKRGVHEIDLHSIQRQLEKVVDANTLNNVLATLKGLHPSPVKSVSDTGIHLNALSEQYAVTPTTDHN
jgi:hypothetical protein